MPRNLAPFLGSADRLVAVDVETTGLGAADRIVEIGMITIDPTGTIIDRFETLVDPGRDTGPVHIHGVTAQMVLGAPTFSAMAGAVAERLDGAVIAAHNAPFDIRMLRQEFDVLESGFRGGRPLDTMSMWGERIRLERLCRELGVELLEHHTAIHDAAAVVDLVFAFAERGAAASGAPASFAHRPDSTVHPRILRPGLL